MQIYFVNGSFVHKSLANISVEDRGFNFSDGVYEVISFSKKTLLNLDRHFLRLKRSLRELKIDNPYKNFKSLELIIKRLLNVNNLFNGFIYLQITRGTSERNHQFPQKVNPNIVIFAFPQKKIDKILKGVGIGTSKDIRWKRCDIKSISLLPNLLEKQKAVEKGFFEIWQYNDKFITEGSTSNAFIIKNMSIVTHPKNQEILGGVTRDCVIDVAKKNNIEVLEVPFSIKELKSCSEAFLSSTTVGIIPVISVDKSKIGNGNVGPITKKLMDYYKIFLNDQIHHE